MIWSCPPLLQAPPVLAKSNTADQYFNHAYGGSSEIVSDDVVVEFLLQVRILTVVVGDRGTSLLSRSKNIDDNYDNVVMDQLVHRRSVHALRLMIEHERERQIRCSSGIRTKD